jgi:dTDP-4-dehydrorhamnose reductase
VFDGHHAPYRETDPVAPINLYGEHKVMAEAGMRSRCPQTTICRLPLMYGTSPYAPSFLQGFLQKLQAGEPLQLFTDEFRTPASGLSVARGILLALGSGVEYLHLGGPERLSRYAFGQLLVEILGLPETLLQPCLQADVHMPAARPGDVALDSTLAFGLGYHPSAIKPELEEIIHA